MVEKKKEKKRHVVMWVNQVGLVCICNWAVGVPDAGKVAFVPEDVTCKRCLAMITRNKRFGKWV